MSSQLETVQALVLNTQQAFDAVLCDKSITFQREAEFAMQVMQGNDYLIKCAVQNPQSVIDAVTNIAAIGISLNPAKKHAYLVPRKGKICLDISYMGLMDLAIQSGSILWAQAVLVREGDKFTVVAVDRPPVHERNPFATDRGEIVGVYVVAKTADGDYLTETMTTAEVNEIRDRSEAWKAWIEKQKKCPWVTDWSEMAKKTVVKRAQKYWPKTERLEAAVHHMDTDGGEGIVIEAPQVALTSEQVDDLLAKINDYTDADALRGYWPELSKFMRESASGSQYEFIKQKFVEKGKSLEQVPA